MSNFLFRVSVVKKRLKILQHYDAVIGVLKDYTKPYSTFKRIVHRIKP
jgi:hypothetical protein